MAGDLGLSEQGPALRRIRGEKELMADGDQDYQCIGRLADYFIFYLYWLHQFQDVKYIEKQDKKIEEKNFKAEVQDENSVQDYDNCVG